MNISITTTPSGWLAFELSILHRLKFESVAMPITGDPSIGYYLRRRGLRIASNSPLRSDWHRSMAAIQNSGEQITDDEINQILLDVYVPGHRLRNPALRKWFSETDAWWFDNIRSNIDGIDGPLKFAIAVNLVIHVGEYVHSFDNDTGEFRQPLSHVFRRYWMSQPEPLNTTLASTCSNKSIEEFVAEATADLMFLRLPKAEIDHANGQQGIWREDWLRGGDDLWEESAEIRGLERQVKSKSQYLRDIDSVLGRASHIKSWAISHVETGFVSANEIAEIVGKHRAVEAIYTKDFTELTGKKAVIITA